jgi:16S rRNA (guanine966-N2)-methyltransferase
MPRVIAGRFRGLKLFAPKGAATRPTADQVKEAVFSMLVSLPFDLEGARVLDCFAGSGGLAIEALSRGAASAALVDSDREALAAIERNLSLLKPRPGASVIRARWPQAFDKFTGQAPFDLFFLDPPYENQNLPLALLKEASQRGLAAPGAVAVWEQAPATLDAWGGEDSHPWHVVKTRAKGGQALAFLRNEV